MVRVKPFKPLPASTYELSTLDQFAARVYTTILLAFELSPQQNVDEVFEIISRAVSLCLTDIPPLAGRVVPKLAPQIPLRKVVVSDDADVELATEDLRDSPSWKHGDYRHMRAHGFPTDVSHNEPIVLPSLEIDQNDFPCFIGKVTFISGGCFFAWGVTHLLMDGGGVGLLYRRLAKYCRAITAREVPIPSPLPEAAYNRKLMSTGTPPPDASAPFKPPPPPAAATISRTVWLVTASKLAGLKNELTAAAPGIRLSTNDSLSVLVWSAACRARRLKERDYTSSNLVMVISVRDKLKGLLPDPYWGNAAVFCPVSASVDEAIEGTPAGLASLARQVRQALTNFNAEIEVPGFIGRLQAILQGKDPGKSRITNVHMGSDILLSSMKMETMYNEDFGRLLNKPDTVRAPNYGAPVRTEGVVNIWPTMRDGAVEIMTQFDEPVAERLLQDPLWRRFAEPLNGQRKLARQQESML